MRLNSHQRCARGRRGFLLASAALGTNLLLPGAARAAQIKKLEGEVSVNGKPVKASARIKPGDVVVTGAGAKLVFVVGQDAFLLRAGSKLKLEASGAGNVAIVSGLRLLTGALLAVFGKGAKRIETAAATARIRGTGVYIEASPEQTYFCTCYGEVELLSRSSNAHKLVVSGYHTPTMIYAQTTDGKVMAAAPFRDHTDEELIMLSRLVGQPSPIEGREKRLKDGGEGQTQGTANPAPQQSQTAAPQPTAPADKESTTPSTKKQPSAKQPPGKKPSAKKPPADQAAATAKPPSGDQAAVPQPQQAPVQATQQPAPDATVAAPAAPPPEPEVPRELPPATLDSPAPRPRSTQ